MNKNEIRERSEKDSISMGGCAWAFKDREELLDLVDAQAAQLKEGREIMGEAWLYLDGHAVMREEIDAWLKKVSDEV